jgi:uncharacterized protein YndB with AHSA1/START domain
MPALDDATTVDAPPEEVWKLLYDPSRFPEWWDGLASVEDVEDGRFTIYPEGYPDFPMPQMIETRQSGRRAVISCLVSNLRFEWVLEPEGERTRVRVHMEIPEEEAHRFDDQRQIVSRSLENLSRLAAASS